MELSFKTLGQALPPWREAAAMLTKWPTHDALLAPLAADCSDPPTPGSPAPPCRCCDGDPAAAAAAACGREPLSPCSVLDADGKAIFDGSNPTSPMAHRSDSGAGVRATARPQSLLSRSLETLRRSPSADAARRLAAHERCWWEQPRTIVVRRSCS